MVTNPVCPPPFALRRACVSCDSVSRSQVLSLSSMLRPLTLPGIRRAINSLYFCALSIVCSRTHRASAWTSRPSLHHAHGQKHGSDVGSFGSTSTRRSPSRLSPVAEKNSEVSSSRWRVSSYTTGTAVAAVRSVAASSGDEHAAVGYTVEHVGKCKLQPLPPLKNRYYALRHGQSVANMEGIISSNPEVGSVKHGLTSNGRTQARVAATALIEVVGRDRLDSLVFISSEFLRARQTAEECRAALTNILSFERQADAAAGGGGGGEEDVPDEGKESPEEGGGELSLDGGADVGGYDVSPPIVIRRLLNERSFGELDGTILVNYNKVWPEDLKDGSQKGYGVESVCDVASRVGSLVRSLEREYEDADIVLSSHADTLQIAQCHIAGADERLFSQYRFKNGEVRSLLQDPSSLPPPAPLSFQ